VIKARRPSSRKLLKLNDMLYSTCVLSLSMQALSVTEMILF